MCAARFHQKLRVFEEVVYKRLNFNFIINLLALIYARNV